MADIERANPIGPAPWAPLLNLSARSSDPFVPLVVVVVVKVDPVGELVAADDEPREADFG